MSDEEGLLVRNARAKANVLSSIVLLLLLCISLALSSAMADGVMPLMPAPPTTPVYWQLTAIQHEPAVTPASGFTVDYQMEGIPGDLSDGLMLESIQETDAGESAVTLTIAKGDAVMEHRYAWTPLPIYLEPGVAYPVTVTGTEASANGSRGSLFAVHVQGKQLSRISANGYTGHDTSVTFDLSTDSVYIDGSLVVSFVLRDSNDMIRLRTVYTYTMSDGAKPMPTPIPGFVALPVPDGVVPAHYDAVPGKDGLWTVTTAPDEYRAYGSMSGSDGMFFPADANGRVVMDAPRVDPAADFSRFVQGFVPVTPESVPAQYPIAEDSLYGFITRDGEEVLRAYGRVDGGEPAFYPVDETGAVTEGAAPVSPAEDFETYVRGFGVAAPSGVPAPYAPVSESVYAFTGRDGETRYRTYGRMDGAEPAFYPADAHGAVAEGAKPVTPQEDFDAYIKGFDPLTLIQPPAFYRALGEGFYTVDDRDGNPVYRVYGVLDGQAPAFYPADAEGNIVEGAASVQPDDDFTAYVAGFTPTEMPDPPTYYDDTDVPDVWSFGDIHGQTQYRAYGSLNRGEPSFYPSDAQGAVSVDALPVNPASDLASMPPPSFAPQTPAMVPEHYTAVEGTEGLYTFDDRDGNPVYRSYGAYGKADPHFYPADETGTPPDDADPADPEQDYTDYFEGFEPKALADQWPSHYEPVAETESIFTFTDKYGQPVYRIYGSVNRGEPAFYPSDEWGNVESMTPVEPNDDIALLPTPYAGSVVIPGVTAKAGATPVVRTVDAWAKEETPAPTDYSGNVLPSGTPPQGGPTPVTRAYTPTPTNYVGQVVPSGTPEQGASTPVAQSITPSPTEYVANVVPSGTPVQGVSTPVAQAFTPGPSATAETLPTSYFSTTNPAATGDTGEAVTVVSRVDDWKATQPVDAQPVETERAATKNPTQGTTPTQGATPTQALTASPTAQQTAAGTPAATEQAPTPTESITEQPTTTPTETAVATPTVAPEETGGGKTYWWIAFVVAGLAAIGGGGYAAFGKRKK